MTRLWCMEEHSRTFLNICIQLGPLVTFESLLSLYGGETAMFNDMIVVVEDLRNVEFNLILVDKRSKLRLKKNSGGQQQKSASPSVPILEYHSFPLPRITGSRSSLKVSQGAQCPLWLLILDHNALRGDLISTFRRIHMDWLF